MEKRAKLIEDVKALMGSDLVGVIDRPDCLGFATNEPDRGEQTPAKYCEAINEKIRANGLVGVNMAFPVKGRLVYDVRIRG